MGTFAELATTKETKKNKTPFKLERNKNRQATEIYNLNGMLLGYHEWHNGNIKYWNELTKQCEVIGSCNSPFEAGNKLLEHYNSQEHLRQANKEEEYQKWLNLPLVKIMMNDYNNLPDNFFKPKEFKTFYRSKIYEYESKYPELIEEV